MSGSPTILGGSFGPLLWIAATISNRRKVNWITQHRGIVGVLGLSMLTKRCRSNCDILASKCERR